MLGDQVCVGADELGESQQANIFQVRVTDDEEVTEFRHTHRGKFVAGGSVDDVREEAAGDETGDTFVEQGLGRGGADKVGDWGDEFLYKAGLEGGEGRELDPGWYFINFWMRV